MSLSEQTLVELASHEGAVLEAYKDSVGVWTWGVGMTNASGHEVHPRYKDQPQTLEYVLEKFEWCAREKYLPAVLEAFKPLGRPLTENEQAAALSFHYNTGGIARASWVKQFCAGDVKAARKSFMNWQKPPEVKDRRQKECNLFFDGTWSNNGTVTVWGVEKPSYKTNWNDATSVRPEFNQPPQDNEESNVKDKAVAVVVIAALTAVIATLSELVEWLKGLL